MGCFLGCFGFKKKRKHRNICSSARQKKRKHRNICSSARQSHGSYVPLGSEISKTLDVAENRVSSDFQSQEKRKDSMKSKIKKKVTFNLNVKAYEPIIQDKEDGCSYLSEDEERTKWEFNSETISKSIQSFPANYRYQNCRDNCDFEDEELDWDEDEFYSDEDGEEMQDDEYGNGSDEEFSWKSNPMYDQHIGERKTEQLGGLLKTSSDHTRSECVHSVLNPVENLSQWKEIKARAEVQFKRDKENITLEQREQKSSNAKQSDSLAFRNDRNISAIDASLSNWIGSMETQRLPRIIASQRYKSQ